MAVSEASPPSWSWPWLYFRLTGAGTMPDWVGCDGRGDSTNHLPAVNPRMETVASRRWHWTTSGHWACPLGVSMDVTGGLQEWLCERCFSCV